MKVGRQGRGRDGVWTREPSPDTAKQIEAGMIRREKVEGGYILTPVTLEAKLLSDLTEGRATKKAVLAYLQDRISRNPSQREMARLEAAVSLLS